MVQGMTLDGTMRQRAGQLIRERTQPDTHSLYFRDGQPIPEVIDPARVIYIKRTLIDPPEREEEQLPEVSEKIALLPESDKGFDRPIMYLA
jgi:hypothetical protein